MALLEGNPPVTGENVLNLLFQSFEHPRDYKSLKKN